MIDDYELREYWEKLLECSGPKPPRPTETNKSGGFEPDKKDVKKWKHADLITLPSDVLGTNCSNCKYISEVKNGVGWCKHEEIHQWVTKRMCCAYWDNDKVKRAWNK